LHCFYNKRKIFKMKKRKKIMKKIIGTTTLVFAFLGLTFAQSIDQSFFKKVDGLLKANVKAGLVDYTNLKGSSELKNLIEEIATADLSNLDANTLQAFYINAYNLNVINQVVKDYPVKSVMDKGGFFDSKKITVAKGTTTLNQLEKGKLLSVYNDARFHFVLVCGANGCPPITNFAYTPAKLEAQLEEQTKLALNDNSFIKVGGDGVELSEIFNWYATDFGKNNEAVISYINKYRNNPISTSAKIKYYTYDWSLNDQAKTMGSIEKNNIEKPKSELAKSKSSNESRYIVSSTIPQGSYEIKVFNNLYSQQTGNENELTDRSSFYTTSVSTFYGLTNRLNVGVATRWRKVRNNSLPSSPFSVFGSDDQGSSRAGLTALGPQIRYAPVPRWENFSIQSSFVFPIGEDLDGGDGTGPFIDWDGPTWNTQLFNDFSIGSKFSLFTELDFLLEGIGSSEDGRTRQFSTPVTAIFSYIPTNQLTIYTLAGYSPFWGNNFFYFRQFGIGSKYQFTPKFELEVLYTDFANTFVNEAGGQAETINLGVRINI